MLCNKWILVQELTTVSLFTHIQETNVGICWLPKNTSQFLNKNSLTIFYSFPQNTNIIIGLNRNIMKEMADSEEPYLFSQQLTRFFFHTSYRKKLNTPLLYCFDEPKMIPYFYNLSIYIKEQGFKNLDLSFFNESDFIPTIENFDNRKFIKNTIQKITSQNLFSKNVDSINLFLDNPNFRQASSILAIIDNIETDLNKNDRTYKMLNWISLIAQENEKLNFRLKKNEAENTNSKMYLTLQEKSANEILSWYNNEYEILPLWYKQFGHIIKVIMGKRSFRSLFDDNVKKYKD